MTRSEQARADALADAETLRSNASLPKILTGWSLVNSATNTGFGAETFSMNRAREAARAAFRAVPGLKRPASALVLPPRRRLRIPGGDLVTDQPITLRHATWCKAELHPRVEQAVDRAGNRYPYLTVSVFPGTELGSEYVRDKDGQIVSPLQIRRLVLEKPVQVVVRIDGGNLAGMVARALRSKSGKSKVGPLIALRTVKMVATVTVVTEP